jgi:hypothetical protein
MRFERVLHPEIVLGLRGSRSFLEFYKKLGESLFVKDGSTIINYDRNDSISQLLFSDEIFRKHYLLTQEFKKSRGNVFYLNKNLVEALGSIDREIPIDLLPPRFSGYFLFEEGSVFDEETEIEGGYVSVTDGAEAGMIEEYWGTPVLWMSYIPKTENHGFGPISSLLCELTREKLSQIIERTPTKDVILHSRIEPDEKTREKRNRIWRILLNSTIYLHASGVSIQKCPSFSSLGISKKELKRRKISLNLTKVPIFLVDKSFSIKREYSVDQTVVRSHFRFQRHGKESKEVKLVLVREHERYYKQY